MSKEYNEKVAFFIAKNLTPKEAKYYAISLKIEKQSVFH